MTILNYFFKKIILLLLTTLIIISISYFLVAIFIPKSFFNNEQKSIFFAYINYIKDIFVFNFGTIFDPSINGSFYSIPHLYFNYFKWSFLIIIFSFVLGIIIGYFLGLILSYKYKKNIVLLLNVLTFSFSAIPIFVLAPIFINLAEINNIPTVFIPEHLLSLKETFYSLFIPILILLLGTIATFSSLTFSTIAQLHKSEFIIYLRGLGMNGFQIFYKGILRNSWSKLISFLVPIFVSLITFSLIIERIFQIPGQSTILNIVFDKGETNIIMFLILFNSIIILTFQLISEIFQKYLLASDFSKKQHNYLKGFFTVKKLFKKEVNNE
ncbi:ABC transporter permease subunit [Mycoplasmopsis alligatoris]|uniref:ABC transporter, permease protein n=1 Tax=Mycoplasmopsis alligatoris A21JP2 TaxID=747682 RepID=D4XV30_9BACT|nr:ABC transporter permease [Mycoplasmopsis alligatoris]EFF41857.1 ABC transporter, permease protein [Mycoplasmopsis alligatoris A21JP2]